MQELIRRLFFGLWYFRNPPWDTGITPPELVEFIATHAPGRALDLGCGTGTNVINLAQHGWQVTGIDFAGRAIRIAQRKVRMAGLKADLRVGDVTKLAGIRGPFDLILDIGCFHSLTSKSKRDYVHNLTQILAPGGRYLMYAFFKTTDKDRFGLSQADLELLGDNLTLDKRQDGTERGRAPSAWFTFRRKSGDE